MASYVLEGPRWKASVQGATSVTWSLDATMPAAFRSDIVDAFAAWSNVANITFTQVASGGNITLGLGAIDGVGKTLGVANYTYRGDSFVSARITFDTGDGWSAAAGGVVSVQGADFGVVAIHEIGHAIGLGHDPDNDTVMNATLNPRVTALAASDIAGVQALYGTGTNVVLAAYGPVDQGFYFARYADVAASGQSAASHYDANGWKEGRDPSAYFATSGYLAANPDVKAAGVNPLAQFDAGGWREGRDPSAGFDVEMYLRKNPDVAAAGVDPLSHYLVSGQKEGRAAYAAVGKAGDLGARGGFDAQFYLLANPDVAKAAVAAGGDSFAFAQSHYAANGWREGRDPNAYFSTKGYLAAYGDVKGAGTDPLAHYHDFGWKEGRDPSGAFDTDAYRAAYGDVAAAGIDPLLHYLQFGRLEGRAGFADGVIA